MNVMQMLFTSNIPTLEGSLANTRTGSTLPGQSFSKVLTNYAQHPNFGLVETGEVDPFLLFGYYLNEIMAALEEEDGSLLTEAVEKNYSLFPDISLDGEEGTEVEKSDLLNYLQHLLQESGEENTSYHSLLSLFLEIPELPRESFVAVQNNGHLPGDKLANESNLKAWADVKASDALMKWNTLLHDLHKYVQSDKFLEENRPTPLQQLLLSITQKWSQDKDLLAYLQDNVKAALEKAQLSFSSQQHQENKPVFVSYPPTSLLALASKESGLSNVEQGYNNLLNKNEVTSSALGNMTSIETEGKETVMEFRDKVQQQAISKPSESASSPSARFGHLVEDMQGILRNQFSLLKNGETSQLRVRLTPEHLGHLDIRITSVDGKIMAQIMTNSKMAKELLDVQISQLRTTLTQQGIQVERIEVTQNTNSSNNLLQQEQRQSQQFNQQRGQKGNLSKQHEYVEVEKVEESTGNYNYQASQVNYAV